MYCNYYGFSEKPFNITPDSRFLFQASNHREILASLIYGIQERRGFIFIVGEIGTGKTTLLNAALNRLDDKTKVAFIFNTNFTFKQILNMALYEWGLVKSEESLSKVNAIRRLNNFAIQQLAKGGNVVLIVDEAQNLENSAIENLRLLSNLETQRNKLIQIVLSGQPELDSKLNQHELRQLAQRISLKRYISPLSEKEVYEYIQHRLAIAGYKGPFLFSREARQLICKYSGGVPRKINILCDNAFLIGYGLGKKKIDADVIKEAIRDLSWSPFLGTNETQAVVPLEEPNPKLKRKSSRNWFAPGVALALTASLVFVLMFLSGNSQISLRRNKFLFADNVVHNNKTNKPNSSDQTFTSKIPVVNPRSEMAAKIITQDEKVVHPRSEMAAKIITKDEKKNKKKLIPHYPYSLRLSCLRNKKYAEDMLSSYKRNGLSPYMIEVNLGKRNVWWTIYTGSYQTREEAEEVKKKFKLKDAIVSKTPYANFIGDFSSESDIGDSVHQLEKLGYSTYFIRKENGTLRLFTGASVSWEAAEKRNAALKANGIQSKVVKR